LTHGGQKGGAHLMAEQSALEGSDSIPAKRQIPLSELALFFFRLGTLAFGGPAAHIAMMEDELVRRRHWLSREKFLDLLGASNLIPGPSSSELAIHIGYFCAGSRGLLIAGSCFVLPAVSGLRTRIPIGPFWQAPCHSRHPLWNQPRLSGREERSPFSVCQCGRCVTGGQQARWHHEKRKR
jgi:hypothetical protein